MKIAFFISDEGYGHSMRQKNIIGELLEHCAHVSITVFTKDKISLFQDTFDNRINYVNIFNYILLSKDSCGTLEPINTWHSFQNWYNNLDYWLNCVMASFDPDTHLIVSDSVPQVTLLYDQFKVKTIFIQHFTWDWFYSTLYGDDTIYHAMHKFYSHPSGSFLFPPLTPKLNLDLHPSYQDLDFIVNKQLILSTSQTMHIANSDSKLRLLLMNNGTNSITSIINNVLLHLPILDNWQLVLRNDTLSNDLRSIALSRSDVLLIDGLNSMHLELSNASLVLARPGYNIISETYSLRKHVVFLDEPSNPEINSNLDLIRNISHFHISPRQECLSVLHSLLINSFKSSSTFTTALGSSQAMLHIVQSILYG